MNENLIAVGQFLPEFNNYLSTPLTQSLIYRSVGLEKHILKRHPDCLKYICLLPAILAAPDYIGVNPNEPGISFELVKTYSKNVQIGIKLDEKNKYLYIATLHTITTSKLNHYLSNGRLASVKFYSDNGK